LFDKVKTSITGRTNTRGEQQGERTRSWNKKGRKRNTRGSDNTDSRSEQGARLQGMLRGGGRGFSSPRGSPRFSRSNPPSVFVALDPRGPRGNLKYLNKEGKTINESQFIRNRGPSPSPSREDSSLGLLNESALENLSLQGIILPERKDPDKENMGVAHSPPPENSEAEARRNTSGEQSSVQEHGENQTAKPIISTPKQENPASMFVDSMLLSLRKDKTPKRWEFKKILKHLAEIPKEEPNFPRYTELRDKVDQAVNRFIKDTVENRVLRLDIKKKLNALDEAWDNILEESSVGIANSTLEGAKRTAEKFAKLGAIPKKSVTFGEATLLEEERGASRGGKKRPDFSQKGAPRLNNRMSGNNDSQKENRPPPLRPKSWPTGHPNFGFQELQELPPLPPKLPVNGRASKLKQRSADQQDEIDRLRGSVEATSKRYSEAQREQKRIEQEVRAKQQFEQWMASQGSGPSERESQEPPWYQDDPYNDDLNGNPRENGGDQLGHVRPSHQRTRSITPFGDNTISESFRVFMTRKWSQPWKIDENNLSNISFKDVKNQKMDFDGEAINYRRFRSFFKQNVHANTALTISQKVVLLKEMLDESVVKFVGIDHTDEWEEYNEFLTIMDETYDLPIADAFLRELDKVPTFDGKIESLLALRGFVQKAKRDVPKENDSLFVSKCLKKLGSLAQIFGVRHPRERDQTLQTLTEFIASQWQILRRMEQEKPDQPFRNRFSSTRNNNTFKRNTYLSSAEQQSAEEACELEEEEEFELSNEQRLFVAKSRGWREGLSRCPFCQGEHLLMHCQDFGLDLDQPKRVEFVKQQERCPQCLSPRHNLENCTRNQIKNCSRCDEKGHHTMLHPPGQQSNTTKLMSADDPFCATSNGSAISPEDNDLVTVNQGVIQLRNPKNLSQTCVVNALFDSGSNGSYIDKEIAKEFGLKGPRGWMTIHGVGGEPHRTEVTLSSVIIESMDGKTAEHVPMRFCKDPSGGLEYHDWNHHLAKFPEMKDVQLPEPAKNAEGKTLISTIIGNDLKYLLKLDCENGKPIQIGGNGYMEPMASKTRLGWSIGGYTGQDPPTLQQILKGEVILSNAITNLRNDVEITQLSDLQRVQQMNRELDEGTHRLRQIANGLRELRRENEFRNGRGRKKKLDSGFEDDPELTWDDQDLLWEEGEGVPGGPGGQVNLDHTGVEETVFCEPLLLRPKVPELVELDVDATDQRAILPQNGSATDLTDGGNVSCLARRSTQSNRASPTHLEGKEPLGDSLPKEPIQVDGSGSDLEEGLEGKITPRVKSLAERALEYMCELPSFDGDEIGLPPDELRAEESFIRSFRLGPDGHWLVAVSWKDGEPDFPDNYERVAHLYNKSERSWIKNGTKQFLDDEMRALIANDYIRELADTPENRGGFFLPQFLVCNERKTTSSHRMVLNARAPFPHKGSRKCLNDGICDCPNNMQSLFGCLRRARIERVLISGDIKQMFLQLFMDEDDQYYVKLVWREGLDPNAPLRIFAFRCHLFGKKDSPYLAIEAIRTQAKKHREEFPEAHESIINSVLVDDLLDSRATEDGAEQVMLQTKQLLKEHVNMNMRKWITSSKELRDRIPEEERAPDIALEGIDKKSGTLTRTLGLIYVSDPDQFTFQYELEMPKKWTKRRVLGLLSKIFDPLGFLAPYTTRGRALFQHIVKKYDGDNWNVVIEEEDLIPFKEWLKGSGELDKIKVPRCLFRHKDESPEFGDLTETRCDYEHVVQSSESNYTDRTYHVFTSASTEAYAVSLYQVTHYDKGSTTSRLAEAKGRVVPVKAPSESRMELEAALMGMKVAKDYADTFGWNLRSQGDSSPRFYFWTDSPLALMWISTREEPKLFVQNRRNKILQETDSCQWNYCSKDSNPAKLASEGTLSIEELRNSSLWWHGPAFLKKDKQDWPDVVPLVSPGLDREMTPSSNGAYTFLQAGNQTLNWSSEPESLPNWHPQGFRTLVQFIKFVAIMKSYKTKFLAYIADLHERGAKAKEEKLAQLEIVERKLQEKRQAGKLNARRTVDFYKQIRKNKKTELTLVPEKLDVELNFEENFQDVLDETIKQAQREGFGNEIRMLKTGRPVAEKSPLAGYAAFLDEQGFVKVCNRVATPGSSRQVIALPKGHPVTKLIALDVHERRQKHVGKRNWLVAQIASDYHVEGLHTLVVSILKNCYQCNRRYPRALQQEMAPLHVHRQPGDKREVVSPFAFGETVSLDVAGPFLVSNGPRKPKSKKWALVFCCNVYRAIHVELLDSCDAKDCLATILYFMYRRGVPRAFVSDRATNFVKADSELKKVWQGIAEARDKVDAECRDFHKIEWIFCPARTPSQNGSVERMVGTFKRALGAITPINPKNGELKEKELRLLFAKAETLINSRPLTNNASVTSDEAWLTPLHFMVGSNSPIKLNIPHHLDNLSNDVTSRWMLIEKCLHQFWTQWWQAYAQQLKLTKRWRKGRASVKPGQIVMVLDKCPVTGRTPGDTLLWPLARVLNLKKDSNDNIQSVGLRFKSRYVTRGIRQIAALPGLDDDDLLEEESQEESIEKDHEESED